MSYFPPTGSTVAFQSDPTKLVGTVSVIGNSSVQIIGTVPPTSVSGVGIFNTNHIGNGSIVVLGNVDSGTVDAGAPVKIGGKYNATKPTFGDSVRGDLQITSRGALVTTLFANDAATAISAEADDSDGVAASATANNLSNVSRTTMFNGTSWDRIRGTTAGGLYTQTTGSVAATVINTPQVSVHGTVKIFPSSTVTGHGSVNGAASVQVLAAPGAGLYNYVTDFTISNTGSVATLITFTDGDTSIIGRTIAPAGGGSNGIGLLTPMKTLQTNKVVNIESATAASIVYAWVGGYKAP